MPKNPTHPTDRVLRTKNAKTGAITPKERKPRTPMKPEEWGPKFLEKWSETNSIQKACKLIGIDRSTVYDRIERDKEFADAFERARLLLCDNIDGEIYRRGVIGEEEVEPIFFRGETNEDGEPIIVLAGYKKKRKTSDRMLELLARAYMPNKYADRQYTYNVDITELLTKIARDQNVPVELLANEVNNGVRQLMADQAAAEKRQGIGRRR